MGRKAAPKKAAPKKVAPKKPPHRANLIERVAERLEERFFEGAELATETSSAETNVALAALGAIEGPRKVKQPARPKATNAKRKSPRPKKR
jgi:acyl-CoA reductase-like NAD-dependent aldehyde dehydrogenase